MKFTDSNKFRFEYSMNNKYPILGEFRNTSASYVPKPEDKNLSMIDLKQSSTYKNYFDMTFNESLNGLTVSHSLLFSNETHNLSLYNNWNFTTLELWDEFWFEPETKLLY